MLISAELVKPSASYKLKWLVVSGVRETMLNKHQQKHISGEIKGMNPTCSTFPPCPWTKHPQKCSLQHSLMFLRWDRVWMGASKGLSQSLAGNCSKKT